MQKRTAKKPPKAILMIPILVVIIVTTGIVMEGMEFKIPTSIPSGSPYDVFSGPFAINSDTYDIDESLFFVSSGIPPNEKGEIIFTQPDGKINHKLPFDGSKGPIKHYFTPVQSDNLDGCSNCELFGTWEISFEMTEGRSYDPIYFTVEDNLKETDFKEE